MASILAQEVAELLGQAYYSCREVGPNLHPWSSYSASVRPKYEVPILAKAKDDMIIITLSKSTRIIREFQLPSSYTIAYQVKMTYDSCPEQQKVRGVRV